MNDFESGKIKQNNSKLWKILTFVLPNLISNFLLQNESEIRNHFF